MPSSSAKQHNFMAAIANNPAFAKKVGVPQSVGKDFSKADKGRKFAQGGEMKESKAMVGKEVAFMKKMGAPKSMVKHEAAEMGAMKMAKGGGIESKGKTKGTMIKMAAGGFVSKADGVAQRGKTKGRYV